MYSNRLTSMQYTSYYWLGKGVEVPYVLALSSHTIVSSYHIWYLCKCVLVHEISKLHIVVLTTLNLCCMVSSLGFNFAMPMLCMCMKFYIVWSIRGNLTMGWANHIVFVESFILQFDILYCGTKSVFILIQLQNSGS